MTEKYYLLDTNVISGILRKESNIIYHFRQATIVNATFVLSPIVYYESKRGLVKIGASNKLRQLEILFQSFQWEPLRDFQENKPPKI